MTAPVFVAEDGALAGAGPGSAVRIAGAEGRHAVTVRRLRVGEAVDVVDGAGTRASGEVASVDGSSLEMLVRQVAVEPVPVVRVVAVVALIKGDRFDDALAMLTEAGVDEIVPWAAQRSIVQWRGDKALRAAQRTAAVVAEAGKQSRRARFPVVAVLASTAEVAERIAAADAAYVLHESATIPMLADSLPSRGDVVLVTGPEGGITDDELAAFATSGARVVRMGPTVQRAATAAVTAAAVVLSATGRWD